MKTYYVDPDTGSDSNSEAQAQSPATPWASLGKAMTTCDNTAVADGSGVSCYIKVTNGKTLTPAAYLNLNRLNAAGTVVIQPVTNPGDYQSGFTITGAGTGGSLIRHYSAAGSNWRFENCTFAPTSISTCFYFAEQALTGFEMRDCTLTNANGTGRLVQHASTAVVTSLLFTRCTFLTPNSIDYAVMLGSGSTGTMSNVRVVDCNGTFVGKGVWFRGPANVVRVSGGTWSGTDMSVSVGNSGDTKSARNTNVIVEDITISSTGSMHVLMLDGDGVVCRRNVVHTGAAGSGGMAIVCKWGTGYQVYDNDIYAESTTSTGLIVKGVTEASYFRNRVYVSGAGAKGIRVYANDADSNKLCKNVSVTSNRFVTTGTALAISAETADSTGHLVFDENEYSLAGSGSGYILGTTVSPETRANLIAAWLANSTSVAGGWTTNEANAYPLAAVGDVRYGVDRGDGETGTLRASNIGTATGTDDLVTTDLRYGKTVDDIVGDLRLPNAGPEDEAHWDTGDAALVAASAFFGAANGIAGTAVLTEDEVASAVASLGTNISTLLSRVPGTVADKTTLDTIAADVAGLDGATIPTDYQQRSVAVTLPTVAPDGYGGQTGDVTLAATQPNYAPARAGDAMALTSGERTTLANAIGTALLGTGARTVTITVTDGTNPVENATVRLTKGAESYVGATNASGVVTFSVDDGTWAVSITASGCSFTPTTLAVSADTSHTYAVSAVTLPDSEAGFVTGYLYCYSTQGVVESGVTVQLQIINVAGTGACYDAATRSEVSDAAGLVTFANLPTGCSYRVRRGTTGTWKNYSIPSTATSPHAMANVFG
ncbi:MAG: right-handed parallel beta-helix repeat-containing protein [Opitutaceae bacterium]